jgi:hypothetical protein
MYFTVEVLGAKVLAEIDCDVLALQLFEQFSAAQANVIKHPSPPNNVEACVSSHLFLSDDYTGDYNSRRIWSRTKIHRSRSAEKAEQVCVLVTRPPTSITTITPGIIDVLRCDPKPDIGHLYHMIKYPLRWKLEKAGNVLVHASGVTLSRNLGVLFVGGSGAGKTTMMVELISEGLSAIGNDSIFLSTDGNFITASSWPHVIRIGQGTINNNATLLSVVQQEQWPRGVDGKVEIYFDTLNRVFGRQLVDSSTKVGIVVDLKLDHEFDDVEIYRLSPEISKKVIEDRIVKDRFHTGWLPGWSWVEDERAITRLSKILIDSADVYHLRVGTKLKQWSKKVKNLLESVAGGLN